VCVCERERVNPHRIPRSNRSSVAYVLLPTAKTCISVKKKYVVFDGHIDLCLHVNTGG
jgi:hypothetical protein